MCQATNSISLSHLEPATLEVSPDCNGEGELPPLEGSSPPSHSSSFFLTSSPSARLESTWDPGASPAGAVDISSATAKVASARATFNTFDFAWARVRARVAGFLCSGVRGGDNDFDFFIICFFFAEPFRADDGSSLLEALGFEPPPSGPAEAGRVGTSALVGSAVALWVLNFDDWEELERRRPRVGLRAGDVPLPPIMWS